MDKTGHITLNHPGCHIRLETLLIYLYILFLLDQILQGHIVTLPFSYPALTVQYTCNLTALPFDFYFQQKSKYVELSSYYSIFIDVHSGGKAK